MKASWFKNCKTPEQREERRKQILGYRIAFEELSEVIRETYLKKEAVRDYSNPGWMAQQIANNEYNAAVEDLLSLLDLEPRNQRGE